MSAALASVNADERRMLADAVADFGRQHDGVARARRFRKTGEHDAEIWARMAELGWLGVLAPDAAGGLDLGVGELAVVAEALGRQAAPEPFAETAFAQAVLGACADSAAARELLGAIAQGEMLAAVAWQSADGSLSVDAIDDRLQGGRLTATRRLVLPAAAAVFVVAVRDDQGIALYRLPRDAAGLTIATQVQVDGARVATLDLEHVALDSTDRLARGENGEAALRRGLCVARVAASAQLLGLADRLFTLTTDYLAARKQFDRPLSGFQVLRHRAVDLYIQRELMRNALRAALRVFDQDRPLAELQRAAARAKARCAHAALGIGRDAVQMHGAIGYTEDADVGVYLRRVLALAAWLGNAAAQRRDYANLRSARRGNRP